MADSTINLLVIFFNGVYFTLTVYHFLVWAGRRKDLSNLAFALLALCFMAMSIVIEVGLTLPSPALQTTANYLFSMTIACLLPFLGFTIGIIPIKLKKITMLGSSALFAIGVLAILLYLLFGLKRAADIIFYPSLFLYICPANAVNIYAFFAQKQYRNRKYVLFMIGFFILVFSLAACLVFIVYLEISIHSIMGILLFHGPFVLMMFIFAVAVTEKFNREHDDLNELTNNLEEKVAQRTRQLERANRQKTQFMVNFAHETKTPLTLITGCLNEYMRTHRADADLSVVRQYAEKLRHDMVNILDHEKLTRGQIFYNHDQIAPASRLVESQAAMFGELAAKKAMRVAADIAGDVYLRMDPSALTSVVNNLLDNAIKYGRRGGIVRVRLSRDGERITLDICDDGPGIPPNEQAAVFRPFYQLSHRKRSAQGIGMGLNIVKKIMGETKGTIVLASDPGRGTSFTLTWKGLPPGAADGILEDNADRAAGEILEDNADRADGGLPEDAADRVEAPYLDTVDEPEPADAAHEPGRPTVLVVDDNRDIVRFLRHNLGVEYNVSCAYGGREALEILRRDSAPDVIVSDIMMDGMNGYEFYDELASRREWRSIPFIFLTALGCAEERIKGIRKGAVDFISKPFHADELAAKILSLVNIRRALTRENLARVKSRLHRHLNAVYKVRGSRRPEDREELFRQYGISKRQIAIIALLQSGLLRKQISDRMGISINTLNTQIMRIFEKCRVHTKTELLNIFS